MRSLLTVDERWQWHCSPRALALKSDPMGKIWELIRIQKIICCRAGGVERRTDEIFIIIHMSVQNFKHPTELLHSEALITQREALHSSDVSSQGFSRWGFVWIHVSTRFIYLTSHTQQVS